MTTAEILAAFPRYSALIVGDICLDRWCTYDPGAAEPSRETQIPRIGIVATEVTPGGGGTVANNLAALGIGRVGVLGVIGDDGFGWELTRALKARGISTDLLVRSNEMPTFTFTKLINAVNGVEDQPRVDHIFSRSLPGAVEEALLAHLDDVAGDIDVILVSDQAETKRGGVVTPRVRERLSAIAAANPAKVIWVDSRIRIELFHRMILKPNDQEADAASIGLFGNVDYQRLRKHCECPLMFVTKGPAGVLVVDENGETVVPTRGVENPVDICGAGDSFSAGAAVALAVTGSATDASRFGNLVASITIMKKGTGTAGPSEMLAAANE